MQSDYLQTFIADKRAKGVPWQHISAMTNTPMSTLRPYMDLEQGYKAAAIRETVKRIQEQEDAKRKAEERKLKRSRSKHPHPTPEMRLIAAKIADLYGVRYDHLIGRQKTGDLPAARQHLMWALLVKNYSTTLIGDFLSGRDHSTIIYGSRSHLKRMTKKNVKIPLRVLDERAEEVQNQSREARDLADPSPTVRLHLSTR